MTDIDAKINDYFDKILSSHVNVLDAHYYSWLKDQACMVTFTSVYNIFNSCQLEEIKRCLNPCFKGCYEFSFKASVFDSAFKSVVGYQDLNGIFIPHAVCKTVIDNQAFYFDFISEVINKENAHDLRFIALHEFTGTEITHLIHKTSFYDRLLFIWYQQNVYPKKIIRP